MIITCRDGCNIKFVTNIVNSYWKGINVGVHQSSTLNPHLFIVFINDINDDMNDSTPYAGSTGMLLHINGKFTIGKLKSSLLS